MLSASLNKTFLSLSLVLRELASGFSLEEPMSTDGVLRRRDHRGGLQGSARLALGRLDGPELSRPPHVGGRHAGLSALPGKQTD